MSERLLRRLPLQAFYFGGVGGSDICFELVTLHFLVMSARLGAIAAAAHAAPLARAIAAGVVE